MTAAPGPVVFRGQNDNGAKVALISVIGSTTWLDEGTAGNLSAEENRVEFLIGDEVLITIDVAFDDRGTVVERQRATDAPTVRRLSDQTRHRERSGGKSITNLAG